MIASKSQFKMCSATACFYLLSRKTSETNVRILGAPSNVISSSVGQPSSSSEMPISDSRLESPSVSSVPNRMPFLQRMGKTWMPLGRSKGCVPETAMGHVDFSVFLKTLTSSIKAMLFDCVYNRILPLAHSPCTKFWPIRSDICWPMLRTLSVRYTATPWLLTQIYCTYPWITNTIWSMFRTSSSLSSLS